MSIHHFEFPLEARGAAWRNESDLASCGGHSFRPLNDRVRNSNYICRHCGGVISYAEYRRLQGLA
jgi:hypothetical protein